MSRLKWSHVDKGDARHVELTGDVTEASDLAALLVDLAEKNVVDASGVQRINSCGTREWMRFIDEFQSSGKSMVLEKCAPAFVQQFNMISGFVGDAEIRSILAPFVCGDCDHDEDVLVTLSDSPAAVLENPRKCTACGGEMEFDDLAESYLSFMKSAAANG